MGGMLSRSVSMLGAVKTCLRDSVAKACHPRLTRVCSWESSQPPGTDGRLVLVDGVRLLALVLATVTCGEKVTAQLPRGGRESPRFTSRCPKSPR
jgi:hypothetical protein